MATIKQIQFKRTTKAGVKPTAAQLEEGELGINLKDRILYTKDDSGSIIDLGLWSGGNINGTINQTGNYTQKGDTTITGYLNVSSQISGNWVRATGTPTNASQSANIGWNTVSGQGKMDLINFRGKGGGGFQFWNGSTLDDLVSIAEITSSGNFTGNGVVLEKDATIKGNIVVSGEVTYKGQALDSRFVARAGDTVIGNLVFDSTSYITYNNNTTYDDTVRYLFRATCGGNDYGYIGVGASALDDGYLEIGTQDSGNEPIYVRQRFGTNMTPTGIKRSATLLGKNGETEFPGAVTVNSLIVNSGSTGAIAWGTTNAKVANDANIWGTRWAKDVTATEDWLGSYIDRQVGLKVDKNGDWIFSAGGLLSMAKKGFDTSKDIDQVPASPTSKDSVLPIWSHWPAGIVREKAVALRSFRSGDNGHIWTERVQNDLLEYRTGESSNQIVMQLKTGTTTTTRQMVVTGKIYADSDIYTKGSAFHIQSAGTRHVWFENENGTAGGVLYHSNSGNDTSGNPIPDRMYLRVYDKPGGSVQRNFRFDGDGTFTPPSYANFDSRYVNDGESIIKTSLSIGGTVKSALGARSIALGDTDTGFRQVSDGILEVMANNVATARFVNNKITLNVATAISNSLEVTGSISTNSSLTAANNIYVNGTGNKHIWFGTGSGDGDKGLVYASDVGNLHLRSGDGGNNGSVFVLSRSLTVDGNIWANKQSHGFADQWTTVAPLHVDFGQVPGNSDYYPIVRGRSTSAGYGYPTQVELGMLRQGNTTWGTGYLIVRNSEQTGGPQANYSFDISGNFQAPGQVGGAKMAVGVGTNSLAGASIAIGDNDSGFTSGGDGIIQLWCNSGRVWHGDAGQFYVDKQIITPNNGTFNNVYISSDIRLKTNFRKIENALDKVEKLEGLIYDKKSKLDSEEYDTTEAGIIAQTLQEVLPEAVTEVNGILNVSSGATIALLVNAIKELKAKVEYLENK